MFAELKSRALIMVSGPDAKNFLQGLLSNDVAGLGTGLRAAALLSAQGKILFDLILDGEQDGVLLDCEAARVEELIAKLKLYRLRAKVEIARDKGRAVFAAFGAPSLAGEMGSAELGAGSDPRLPALGTRLYGPATEIRERLLAPGLIERPESDYCAQRLALGVPEGAPDLGIEKLFLLEANAEELNGVDFRKGCYVGQELTSRMKRKAELKKRLLPLAIEGTAPAGAPVTAGGELLGHVIGGGRHIAFALLRLDRLAESRAKMQPLKIGEAAAELLVPRYLAGKL
jgi:folate-binding protein YgfZ